MNIHKFTNKPFTKKSSFKLAILIKDSGFNPQKISKHYMSHIVNAGFKKKDVLALSLEYNGAKRVIAKEAKEYLENNIYPICKQRGVKVLMVADAQYFKFITNQVMKDISQNYTQCIHKDYIGFTVIPVVNYMSFFANPLAADTVYLNFGALYNAYYDLPMHIEKGIVKNLELPQKPKDIKKALKAINKFKKLTVDIEGFSLFFVDAGIATISFSQDDKSSTAFYCDYMPKKVWKKYYRKFPVITEYPDVKAVRINNVIVREILYDFFITNSSRYIYHNSNYDAKNIIYAVFMKEDISNIKKLIKGLSAMLDNHEDTYILCYLALNSVSTVHLDLKSNTEEFMGNYGIDVKDITVHTPEKILGYNAQDTIATYHLYEKYKGIPKLYNQLYLYWGIYTPLQITTIQMELMGMGMKISRVHALYNKMSNIIENQRETIIGLPIVGVFLWKEVIAAWIKKLKETKQLTPSITKIDKEVGFNLNSNPQLSRFLFDFLKLPVLEKTPKGKPSMKGKVIDKLIKVLNIREVNDE